jgi:signal transduction histidine kinase
LRNAIYYCNSFCQIEWKINDSNELYIEIVDDGKGVSIDIQDKIFEWRITNNKLDGTGLGLSYVKFVADIILSYYEKCGYPLYITDSSIEAKPIDK